MNYLPSPLPWHDSRNTLCLRRRSAATTVYAYRAHGDNHSHPGAFIRLTRCADEGIIFRVRGDHFGVSGCTFPQRSTRTEARVPVRSTYLSASREGGGASPSASFVKLANLATIQAVSESFLEIVRTNSGRHRINQAVSESVLEVVRTNSGRHP